MLTLTTRVILTIYSDQGSMVIGATVIGVTASSSCGAFGVRCKKSQLVHCRLPVSRAQDTVVLHFAFLLCRSDCVEAFRRIELCAFVLLFVFFLREIEDRLLNQWPLCGISALSMEVERVHVDRN